MQRSSKIARLPANIREEFNQRLDDGQQNTLILQWVNALPETQALLQAEFKGESITKQNLNKWKKRGFVNWQLRQAALDFTLDSLPDDLDTATLEKMSAKLIRHLQLRYAALASTLPPPNGDPDAELRRLDGLCTNLTSLRRGDLSAQRLDLEQQRLAMEKARDAAELETLFWAWTKRPDVVEKLFPHRDPEKIRRQVDRMLSRRLLGIKDPGDLPDETADPACLI